VRLKDYQIKMARITYTKIVQDDFILDLIDTIEALQQENEQLKADCDRMLGKVPELTMEYNHFKERLQISPYGDDKIDELDEALENCKFQYEQLKQENEKLKADLCDKDNEINDLKAMIEYLKKFKPKKNEAVREEGI
jgi:predicted RNase H-like nuclease (RuvC/YqgF family)